MDVGRNAQYHVILKYFHHTVTTDGNDLGSKMQSSSNDFNAYYLYFQYVFNWYHYPYRDFYFDLNINFSLMFSWVRVDWVVQVLHCMMGHQLLGPSHAFYCYITFYCLPVLLWLEYCFGVWTCFASIAWFFLGFLITFGLKVLLALITNTWPYSMIWLQGSLASWLWLSQPQLKSKCW